MRTLLKVIRWLSIAVLGISGLALMVAPALAQRELHASRSLDNSTQVILPEARTTTAVSTQAPARVSSPTQGGRDGMAQPRAQDPAVGTVGDLLGLALLILGLTVALYSRPHPRIEYTTHQ